MVEINFFIQFVKSGKSIRLRVNKRLKRTFDLDEIHYYKGLWLIRFILAPLSIESLRSEYFLSLCIISIPFNNSLKSWLANNVTSFSRHDELHQVWILKTMEEGFQLMHYHNNFLRPNFSIINPN